MVVMLSSPSATARRKMVSRTNTSKPSGRLRKSGITKPIMSEHWEIYADWNPWHGCTKISPGCKYCYVYRQDEMYGNEISSSECRKTGNFNLPVKRKRDKSWKIESGKLVFTCFTSDFLLRDADPNEAEYFSQIRKSIKAQIPADLYNEEKVFHLRGAIDYSQLGLKHRMMMSMFHKMVQKTPEPQRTADAKSMLETYGKAVDFVDYNALEQITSQL